MCTFKEDIANVLRSVNQAGGGVPALIRDRIKSYGKTGPVDADIADIEDCINLYQQGFRDALGAVAAAFGILPQ